MARMLLGDEIDLHSGGEDNIFPHHECEIAQSCCATGRPAFARIWFHTRHLQVEGEKMSKSKGNFFTARALFERGTTPAALRLELIRIHYRTNANFTMQGLQDCQRMVDRWSRCQSDLVARAAASMDRSSDEVLSPGPFERALSAFALSLADDLNVARGIAALNEAVAQGDCRACPVRELSSMLAMDSVLGVLGRNARLDDLAATDLDLVRRVESLMAERAAARAARQWARSDQIRAELSALGIAVSDGPAGATWVRVTNDA
jgi:cysteinyl-tRNA synthetase